MLGAVWSLPAFGPNGDARSRARAVQSLPVRGHCLLFDSSAGADSGAAGQGRFLVVHSKRDWLVISRWNSRRRRGVQRTAGVWGERLTRSRDVDRVRRCSRFECPLLADFASARGGLAEAAVAV